jgi:hypothetical protein
MSTYSNLVYQDSITTTIDETFVPQQPAEGVNGLWAFQQWSAGTQLASDNTSCVIELFWDASGTKTDMTLVDAIYTLSETYQHPLDQTVFYTVDGVGQVVVRRTVLASSTAARQIYAQVQGFVA